MCGFDDFASDESEMKIRSVRVMRRCEMMQSDSFGFEVKGK